jgi:hypothetical protein
LIRLTTAALGAPANALLVDSGNPADRIALKIASAVAGSVRCGFGVMTGVGATVGGGADEGTLAAQAVSMTASSAAAAPRARPD